MDMTVRDWFDARSFRHEDFSGLADSAWRPDRPTTTLIFPGRNVADTIGPILQTVGRLRERTGLIDQVMLVDADSPDGTADVARAHGAEVYSENELMPDYGPAQGKGDAMWRSLSVARGDVVMFADADTGDFGEHFIYGTLGPVLTLPGIEFAKAAYRRPFTQQERSVVDGGGRVTELMAKPLLNLYRPELTGFVQPLAGEFAARRDLLVNLPFLTGYGVELALLIDVLGAVGLPAMAQADLGSRQNRHQRLWDLTRMSSTVLRAMASRLPASAPELPGQPAPAVPAPADPADPGGAGGTPDLLGLDRETYLHAVATEDGLRLDEHLNQLVERPALAGILPELAGLGRKSQIETAGTS
jgi:glucosyl-3-phosphoglycerate synthase